MLSDVSIGLDRSFYNSIISMSNEVGVFTRISDALHKPAVKASQRKCSDHCWWMTTTVCHRSHPFRRWWKLDLCGNRT